MKTKMKKYPLLVSLIVSCVIVVASLFILGFFGMNLGTSLGGGSQFDIKLENDASTVQTTAKVKSAIRKNGYIMDSSFVEDRFVATEENGKFTIKCLVVKIASKNISDEKKQAIIDSVAEALDISTDQISSIENITSSIKAKNVLFVGLAVGLIAICLFVLGWVRYNIFAGLSFILAYLHNIILYLSVLILTRVQLNLVSLSVVIILTLAMSCLLIAVYEKNRQYELSKSDAKMSVSERMWQSEKEVSKPFIIVATAILVFALLLFFVPVASVRFAAINIIIAVIITAYTSILIGPGTYASLMEIKVYNEKAVLSRNENVNKEIKKKVNKGTKKSK